ncbi:unnamed protein product [Linum trigynum]|uniref:Reverse transcriptase domain-containing protein n=1 Tax=Linum trigynum TaxID=586398 RepID=A0AAV2ES07_9ROSI
MRDDQGLIVSDIYEIGAVAVDFYSKLIGTEDSQVKQQSVAFYQALLQNKLNVEEGEYLMRGITRAETKSVFYSLGRDKAPGPDGFPAEFFRAHWDVIGKEVEEVTLAFFSTGIMPTMVNNTIFTLVANVPCAENMKDYRPISCCNMLYKGISKLLANRLAQVLPSVISKSQSAFIKGRAISDNILLVSELVRNYHYKNVSPKCVVKIDIMKAFDSVNWKFLFTVMEAMGFPPGFLKLLSACVTTPKIKIALNGGLCGNVREKKGLRQGDPLSPYLFTIAMEVLDGLAGKAVRENQIPFHPRCKPLMITHLCFADDLMVFTNGSVRGVAGIRRLMDEFYTLSGLQCNAAKCQLFCARISKEEQQYISTITEFPLGSLHVRYLGVPLITGKLSKHDCQVLIDKITQRLRSWRSRLLTYAGHIQLISSVISSTLQYWLNIFLLPKYIIREVERLCNEFLWDSADGGTRKKAVMAWHKLAIPKREGGLGIRNFSLWNKACVLRHVWEILTNGGSLWVAWVSRYRLRQRSFWEISISSAGTWIWRQLLKCREYAAAYISGAPPNLLWQGQQMKRYSVTRVWDTIRERKQVVEWRKLVWSKEIIPRHGFILWMDLHDRLVMQDKLLGWESRFLGCVFYALVE